MVPQRAETVHAAAGVIVASLISYPRAIVLGLLQGVSELFPVSSLGHTVILPQLLGWNIHQNAPYFLSFLVATHFATAIVLFLFFWRDWVRILKGIGRSLRDRGIAPDDADAKLGWLLVVGTIPAGILGLLLQDTLRKAFASGAIAAGFLIGNGGQADAARWASNYLLVHYKCDQRASCVLTAGGGTSAVNARLNE